MVVDETSSYPTSCNDGSVNHSFFHSFHLFHFLDCVPFGNDHHRTAIHTLFKSSGYYSGFTFYCRCHCRCEIFFGVLMGMRWGIFWRCLRARQGLLFFSSFSPLANCQQVIAIETMANWQIYMKQKLIRVDVMVHKVYCDMWVDIRTIYHINLSLVCLDMNKNCIVTHNMSPQGFINETMMQTKYGWKNLLYKTFTELELMDIF